MIAPVAISIAALIVAALALLALLAQRKTLRTLAQQVNDLTTTWQERPPAVPETGRFSAHLADVEKNQQQRQDKLKEKFEESSAVKPQLQTDKYRYAVALAAQGQNADSIAQALNMAATEVEQVLRLAQVKRQA